MKAKEINYPLGDGQMREHPEKLNIVLPDFATSLIRCKRH